MPVALTVLGRSYSFKTLREIRWVSSLVYALNYAVGVLARLRLIVRWVSSLVYANSMRWVSSLNS